MDMHVGKWECGYVQVIMIVDDDPTSLAIGKALLEPAYKIVLMKSGLQALGYLKNNPIPDLILLDLMMPGTSGLDVVRAMQEDPALRNIPVIFLSAADDLQMIAKGTSLGAVDFLQKPVNPTVLREKVERQLDIIRMRQENRQLKARVAVLENLARQCAQLMNDALQSNT